MGIRSIKDYQLVRVTAAGQEYAAFSQTEVRELFRIAHQGEFEPSAKRQTFIGEKWKLVSTYLFVVLF